MFLQRSEIRLWLGALLSAVCGSGVVLLLANVSTLSGAIVSVIGFIAAVIAFVIYGVILTWLGL